MAGKGTMLAKVGWPAKKFYLSPEAIELLRQHCEGTPLTMSAYLDLLIKQNLAAVTSVPSRLVKRIAETESVGRPPRDPREPLGAFQEIKKPLRKKDIDFDL